ncbi:MAG TPA: aminoacyl-tRNA hydrolase [Pirellulaceae bacterium]|nr:aminoacyl-tRNA hydrolase [Pirellulaceae bacterium]HMO91906.1 aminoacyl-tRNA hydrolase [Pirellulaceae bacterium]HMP68706.1 aminoacyl-tRNA hydrolase [Pirellulaceae bacterium]
MKLVIGLGNPERRYFDTRHNVGFAVIEKLAARLGISRGKSRFKGEFYEAFVDGAAIGLLCPLTYMNLSGQAVKPAVDFFRIPLDQILVVCDDLNLDLGRIRIRARGSAGGQKGIENIIQLLGSDEFPRLRIGIGKPPSHMDARDFVLSKFSKTEASEISIALERACDAILCWLSQGIVSAMNRFNSVEAEKNTKKQDDNQKSKRLDCRDGPQGSDIDAKPSIDEV